MCLSHGRSQRHWQPSHVHEAQQTVELTQRCQPVCMSQSHAALPRNVHVAKMHATLQSSMHVASHKQRCRAACIAQTNACNTDEQRGLQLTFKCRHCGSPGRSIEHEGPNIRSDVHDEWKRWDLPVCWVLEVCPCPRHGRAHGNHHLVHLLHGNDEKKEQEGEYRLKSNRSVRTISWTAALRSI